MTISLTPPPPASHPAGIKRIRILHRRAREPLLTLLLMTQIFILFLLPASRAAGLPLPHFVVYAALLFFVTLAAVLSRSKGAIAIMIASVVMNVICVSLRNRDPGVTLDIVGGAGQVLAQLSLLWAVWTAVFGPGRITVHRIVGAIVMYLGIGMIFTSLDLLLAQIVPHAYSNLPPSGPALRETMNYFSFSTLTTGTLGDIIPTHPLARSLANLESICGQLFPATLLARIVSLHASAKDE